MNKMLLLKNLADELNICISDNQLEQFYNYYRLLIEWNEKINLTAITEFEDVLIKHFLDSISLMNYFSFDKDNKILDIGTGAGFPGIPLKIMYPEVEFTLLDSLNKRIIFLDEVIKKIGLHNINTIHGRGEDLAMDLHHRESYDFVVSRAVANLSSLSEISIPFLKIGGKFIAYKADKAQEEIQLSNHVFPILGAKYINTNHFYLAGTDMERNFVEIEKITETVMKYPRKAGTPFKKPL